MSEGIQRKCFCCGNIFFVCKSCWRGQRYCSIECRQKSRKEKLRIYQKKYNRSTKGRESNRLRQQRYRKKRISVTHHSSNLTKSSLFFPSMKVKVKKELCTCCHSRIESLVFFQEAALTFSFNSWRCQKYGAMV